MYLNSLNAQATGYDFSKLSKEEKVSILNDILTAPAFAIDIPNSNRNPASFLPFDGCISPCVASSVK